MLYGNDITDHPEGATHAGNGRRPDLRRCVAFRWPALVAASGQPGCAMTSEATARESSGDVKLVTSSRALALPGRALDHIGRPVLNRPHEEPSRHWDLAPDNTSTGVAVAGRRPSQSLSVVPKVRDPQLQMDMVPSEQNELVNRIRVMVQRWRAENYPGATAATRQLLFHWRSETSEPRLFFAQVEAAETLIWLTEGDAGRNLRLAEFRRVLADASGGYNGGIHRLAVRMATGSGKTAVMGMVIAWHAVNAAASLRSDGRYTTLFLALAPGHTVRERLAVLMPSHPDNIYDDMGLLPAGRRGVLGAVRVRVLNWHAFQPRDRLGELASADAKKLIRAGSKAKESESMAAVLDRALRGFPTGRGAPRVCVLNDEAHHCYLPQQGRRTSEDDDTKAAAVWFGALEGLRDTGRLGPVYDFSATPIFIEGTDRRERMFPWVVSDFPLMDSIESGLVKIPQVPVEDDTHDATVRWRNLYANTTPKTVRRDAVPGELRRALRALYRSYEAKFAQWMNPGDPSKRMPTPPVFIVVANNIANATAICDHIAGWSEPGPGESTVYHRGELALFANYGDNGPTERVHTLLVHSQLESEGALSKPIRAQAARLRTPGDNADDRDVVRGALNSVGRAGGLGEHIRCVVSVSMLTEGWDTRTVTHILGFRRFSTQLLCEQVTGRALRRSNYDNHDDDGRLVAEYAEVIGVPFEFMPVKGKGDDQPPKPRYEVRSLPGRRDRRIEFPNVEHYLTEAGAGRFRLDEQRVIKWVPHGATEATLAGAVGGETTISADVSLRRRRALTLLAAGLVRRWTERLADDGEGGRARRRRLFHEAARIASRWCVLAGVTDEHYDGLGSSAMDQAVREIDDASIPAGAAADRLVAAFSHPVLLDTSSIRFETSLTDRYNTTKSELNTAACHSHLEVACAKVLDSHPDVTGWARNFRLGWTVPYLWDGTWHRYEPDFVARLFAGREDEDAVHLIVECKGVPDAHSERKKQAVETRWIPAVQASGHLPGWLRRWSFVELTELENPSADISEAIRQARKAHPAPAVEGAA